MDMIILTITIMDHSALGIDTHFTFSTDMITQARMWLQSARLALYRLLLQRWEITANSLMSVDQAFFLVTRKGGLALPRPDLGVITNGAKADILVWDGGSPGMLGWNDPVAAIVFHSNVGDIKHVMVGGKFTKRDRRLTSTDYPTRRDKFLGTAAKIKFIWKKDHFLFLRASSRNRACSIPGLQYGQVPRAKV
ncbi:uncharacterized protein KD926_011260 [Aspergillus affinis]|uniref:uncharacterized protein n=1 Tax=Aspergillus affinis TaxID=1070780 RepID=UPI0022FF05D3|nr:uncharacterized protein KD926_011260 [Aspergillus affinis]KAI9038126.1 hypothetical protein KD926_011260 [Aspergillus affinis]